MAAERSDTNVRVGRIAREDVVTVPPDASVGEIARTMIDENVGDVVVTEDEAVAGIVTDRDLVAHLLTDDHGTNVLAEGASGSSLTAEDVMTEDPLTIDAEARVPNLLHHMNQVHARRIPVVEDGRVAGIVTLDDLVVHVAGESAHVAAQLDSLAGVIHAESPRHD